MNATVFIVDDDAMMLSATAQYLESKDLRTRCYRSGSTFLKDHDPSIPGCILLDLVMPDMNGLAVQRELMRQDQNRPIVFLSACAEIRETAEAMKAGAVDFLTKPVDEKSLLSAIRLAIERDAHLRVMQARKREIQERFARLSSRERQVLNSVVAGMQNKQIAHQLGIAEKTVKVHRVRIASKLGIRAVADWVRFVLELSRHPSDG
jgi:FixJ family two-component response regulator